MEEAIKKFVYTSVGMLSAASERLQQAVDDFVGSGQESKEEGKKVVENFQEEMERHQSELEKKGKALMASLEKNAPKATGENVPGIQQILDRLEAIEKKLEEDDRTKGE